MKNRGISSRQPNLCNIRKDRSRPTAAPTTAASGPTALRTAASTTAESHKGDNRCATVTLNLAPGLGIPNTALGLSAAAITATAYLKTVSGLTGDATTTSASITFRSYS